MNNSKPLPKPLVILLVLLGIIAFVTTGILLCDFPGVSLGTGLRYILGWLLFGALLLPVMCLGVRIWMRK
jgi:hypothetical protein